MRTKKAKKAICGIRNLHDNSDFLPEQITALMNKNGLNIKSMALLLNTTPLVVSRWMAGETKPSGSSRRIMQLLDISPEWIELLFLVS